MIRVHFTKKLRGYSYVNICGCSSVVEQVQGPGFDPHCPRAGAGGGGELQGNEEKKVGWTDTAVEEKILGREDYL